LPPPGLLRRALAEGLAAFALVFAGCGAIVTDSVGDGVLGATGVAAVFGLIIMVMIYATGHLSGAHINPAVTIAFTLTRHFPPRDALAYVMAQVVGATAGALLLLAAWSDKPAALGATVPSVATGTALLYEIVLTALLMFVIMAVARRARGRCGGRDRDRRNRRARCALRRPADRRLDEPGALVRPSACGRRVERLLDLRRRSCRRRHARRRRLSGDSHARGPRHG